MGLEMGLRVWKWVRAHFGGSCPLCGHYFHSHSVDTIPVLSLPECSDQCHCLNVQAGPPESFSKDAHWKLGISDSFLL
jgi:hypothetical protein